jgi:hypothetical protein
VIVPYGSCIVVIRSRPSYVSFVSFPAGSFIDVIRPSGSVIMVVVCCAASVRVASEPLSFHVIDEAALFGSVVLSSCPCAS